MALRWDHVGCRLAGLGVFALLCSLWTTQATADIVISGDDWDKFVEFFEEPAESQTLLRTPTTDDGAKSLHMTLPFSDKFAIYELNVTGLPPGQTRFPVRISGRMVTRRDSGLGIRNLTIDPEEDASLQSSFLIVGISHRSRGGAVDDLGATDAEEDVGSVGDRERNPTVPALDDTGETGSPALDINTANATLELVEGTNILRLDATDPSNLPGYAPENGYQIFSITIGPETPGLTGELVAPCTVRRSISPKLYAPGENVTVTLNARNIGGATTITDTFPASWSVADAGGGTVAANTIAFDVGASGTVSYVLSVPGDFCELAAVTGSFAGDCAGDVTGNDGIGCLGSSGVRMTGEALGEFADSRSTASIIETDDGRVSINFTEGEDGDSALWCDYLIDVTLPNGGAGVGSARFPITVLTRQTFDNSTSLTLRNLTIDPAEPDEFIRDADVTDVQDSFVSLRLQDNRGAPARDERWPLGVEGEDTGDDLATGRSGTRRDGAHHSTLQFPEDVSRTTNATLELLAGVNHIRVDMSDVADLPNYEPDIDFQVFEIVIGPDAAGLSGTILGPAPGPFRRGDCNGDTFVDVSDGVAMLDRAFLGSFNPPCLAACDFNGDGAQDVTTAVYLFGALFLGGPAVVEPNQCAPSFLPTDFALGCADPSACAAR